MRHSNNYPRRRFLASMGALPLMTTFPITGHTQEKPIPIRVGIQAQTSWLLYAAQKLKLLEEAGLDPTFVKLTTGAQAIAAMASGNIDMASPGITPVVAGLAQGVEWTVIGMDTTLDFAEGFVAHPDSGIENLEDFKGKTIGVARGSTSYYGLLAALETRGISKDDINLLLLGPAEQVGAMANGDVDGIAVWEPWIQRQIQDNGAVLVGMEGDYGVHTGCATYAVNNTFATENPEAVDRFLTGLLLAYDSIKEDGPGVAIDAVADAMGVSREIAEIMYDEAPVPEIVKWADPNYQYSVAPGGLFHVAAQEMADFLYKENIVNSEVDLSTAFDSKPIARVLKANGRIE